MGAKLSKQLSREQQRHGTKAAGVSSSTSDRKSASTILEMIKPECLKTKKMKKKKKRVEMDPDEKKITKVRKLTLEEWLLASPAPAASLRPADQCFSSSNGGGELYVFKQFSKRVHPSSSSSTTKTTASPPPPPPPREVSNVSMGGGSASFSMDVSSSIMSRSQQSGKSKKRVSFRLPEEADIFVFHSPDEKLESDYESSLSTTAFNFYLQE